MCKQQQVMMDPPSLWNPQAESTEVQNKEYQWLHKMVTCHRKKILKKRRILYVFDHQGPETLLHPIQYKG